MKENITYTVYQNENIQETQNRDTLIIYNLKGVLKVNCSELNSQDVFVVNQNEGCRIQCKKSVYVVYSINASYLKRCSNNKKYSFVCDSSKDDYGNFDRLKKILSEILVVHYSKYEFEYVKLNELYYQLVLFLLGNFAIEQISYVQTEQEQIVNYMENHFEENLSLKTMSRDFGMTEQYFSKYFKKHMNTTYLKYITNLRLERSMDDVMGTKKRIITIAMDNGFSNVGAFNRFFKEKYGITPKECRERNDETKKERERKDISLLLESLNVSSEDDNQIVSLEADSNDGKEYISFWNKILNFGNVSILDFSRVLEGLKDIQTALHFEYIRLVLDESCYKKQECFNFSREEFRFAELYKF